MSRTVPLHQIAHARAGDKGNISSVSVWAYDTGDYLLIKDQITAERVKKAFPRGVVDQVDAILAARGEVGDRQ